MFQFYGSESVSRPWGDVARFKLFDCPWERSAERGREPTLVGHEELQHELYRALSNFAREGRANRLVLMHGPNGSAKSTAASCILRALEDYSRRDEGALYRFHWIFPTRKSSRGSIGFGGGVPGQELNNFDWLREHYRAAGVGSGRNRSEVGANTATAARAPCGRRSARNTRKVY